jgi:transglutaminase-like putative cysteine protease
VEGVGVIPLFKVLNWFVNRIRRRFGDRKPLLLLLLLVMVGSVTEGLAANSRDFDIWLALLIAAVGVVLSLLLATKAERTWSAATLLAVLGLLLVLVAAGRLADELLALFPSGLGVARDGGRVIWQIQQLPDEPPAALPELASSWETFALALKALTEGAGVVADRAAGWALSLLRGEHTPDPVATTFFWALALWVVVVWMIWLVVRRGQVLLGVSPAGALLVTTLFFSEGDHPGRVQMVLSGVLLMMAFVSYDGRVRRLEAADRDIAYGIAGETAVVSILLSAALVTTAALASSVSIQDILDLVRDLAPRQAAEGSAASGGGSAPRPWRQVTTFDEIRRGGLPRDHLLSTPPDELSKLVVMTVSTGELGPMPDFELEAGQVSVPSHYWCSVTYDVYSSRGWSTSGTWTAMYLAGEGAGPEPLTTQRVLRQEVSFVSDLGGILHVDGALVAVDKDYSVAWREEGDAFGGTVSAQAYVADSLMVEPSAEALRAAGTDYPDWIVRRYLNLPESVTARTLALAQDLTATEPTPYDRARAIETYLRSSYTYTLDTDLPPLDQDVVDFFLFDLGQGYCDYYASSMVVLARASGLPARMAIGYAGGRYDSMEARYVVTEADAHAWPEVYFPGFGWVRFEPTAGLPAIDRAEQDQDLPQWPTPQDALLDPGEQVPPIWERLGDRWWLTLLGGGLGVPVVAVAAWLAFDTWRLNRIEPAATVATVYERMRRLGRRMGAPVLDGATPYEYEAAFVEMLKGLARGRRWQETQAAAEKEIERLTDTYVRVSYDAVEPDRIDQTVAVMAWKALRWTLWMAWLRSRPMRRKRSGR